MNVEVLVLVCVLAGGIVDALRQRRLRRSIVSLLFLGTHDDNMADARSKGRFARSPRWVLAHAGQANGNCRLTDEAVAEIRAGKREGLTDRELADRFGTTSAYVNRLVNGRVRAAKTVEEMG